MGGKKRSRKGASRASARLFSGVVERIKELRAQGQSFRDISKTTGVDVRTAWHYGHRVRAEATNNSSSQAAALSDSGQEPESPEREVTRIIPIFKNRFELFKTWATPGIVRFVIPYCKKCLLRLYLSATSASCKVKVYTTDEYDTEYKYGHGKVAWESQPSRFLSTELGMSRGSWVLRLENDVMFNGSNTVTLEMTVIITASARDLEDWFPLVSSA